MATSHFEYIFNHVFLPPKLPEEDDYDESARANLAKEFEEALISCKNYVDEEGREGISRCLRMVQNMIKLRNQLGGLTAEALEAMLNEMSINGMHMRCRNK